MREGAVSDIAAESDEKAMQLYMESGNWSVATETNLVVVFTEQIIAEKLSGRRTKHVVMVEPPAPACLQFFEHTWPSAAGDDVCLHCGCRRIIAWTREMLRFVEYVSL